MLMCLWRLRPRKAIRSSRVYIERERARERGGGERKAEKERECERGGMTHSYV